MTNLLRLSAVAVVAVFGASVASAQSPGLRGVPTQPGVRSVTTVSPMPAAVVMQQRMWNDAFRQAQLWQMYQPRVVVVNPIITTNPWGPSIITNPWGPIVNTNPWGPIVNPVPGTVWNSGNTYYRSYTPRW